MKKIDNYDNYNPKKELNAHQIAFLIKGVKKDHRIETLWEIVDGLVNIHCSFDCSFQFLKDFQGINFGKINGDFSCRHNSITSLIGSPKEITGNFDCGYNELVNLSGIGIVGESIDLSSNKLESLKGIQNKVKGCLNLSTNKLTDLKYCPIEIEDTFWCSENEIYSLENGPKKVGETYGCSSNRLDTLNGAPSEISENFYCSSNRLSTLEGSPKTVGGSFYCSDNKLISLKGGPIKVDRRFSCKRNKLTSLEGAPKKIEGYFDCSDNKIISLEGAPIETGGNKKPERFNGNPVSKETLSMVFDTMETSKITYNEAVKLLITEIPAEDLGVMDLSGIDMSPDLLRVIKSYSRIKGML